MCIRDRPPPEPTGNMEVLTDMIFYRYKSEIPEMLTHVDEREVQMCIRDRYNTGSMQNESCQTYINYFNVDPNNRISDKSNNANNFLFILQRKTKDR